MKKTLFWTVLGMLVLTISVWGVNHTSNQKEIVDTTAVKWYTMEEALAANERAPKALFIDMYTSWCGWCKVMDKKTFTKKEVIAYLNENFYPVKFDAEQREELMFKGKTYQYVKAGRRGIHTLAYTLLGGKASYPSFVILDKDLNHMGIMRGFKEAKPFLDELSTKVEQYNLTVSQ